MEEELFKEYGNSDIVIAGSDEAGRGPLAGPVTAACVILGKDFPLEILDDSKKLTEKERLDAEKVIKEKAECYAVVSLSHMVIDEINILNASLTAMRMAFEKVFEKRKVSVLLVDGNKTPDVPVECHAVVKGDQKVPEIMAASILAKVERDRIMDLADLKWPMYGYKKHKGYPTKAHIEAVKKYGPSPISRKSFHAKGLTPPLGDSSSLFPL